MITFRLSSVRVSVYASVRQHFQMTSPEAAEPILLKFHMESPLVGGTKDC